VFQRTYLNNFLIISLLLTVTIAANAANITLETTNNPAYVAATLDVTCDKAFENFERSLTKLIADIPFVSEARFMGKSEWKQESSDGNMTVSTKAIHLSVNPTLSKEFPTTFVPGTVRKTVCGTPPPNTTSTCTSTYIVAFTGADAVTYQKITESSRTQNWTSSFNGTLTFSDAEANCNLTTQLYIADNTYLWAKKHLIKDMNPTLVESGIVNRFIAWAKAILPAVEGK